AMAGTPPTVPGAPAPVSSLALGTARDPGAAPAALGTSPGCGPGSAGAGQGFSLSISPGGPSGPGGALSSPWSSPLQVSIPSSPAWCDP
ncbi:unnamed protein product, partial [Coccothraustes coccothraustes]